MAQADKIQEKFFHRVFRRLKIRHKLVLLFLPGTILAIFIVGSLWYWSALSAAKKTLQEQTSILARNGSQLLQDGLQGRRMEIGAVAKLNWVEALFSEANRNESGEALSSYQDNLKKLLVNLSSGYFQITCFDRQNRPFAKVELTSYFSQQELPGHFETVWFDAQDRQVIAEFSTSSNDAIYVSKARNIRGTNALVLAVPVHDSRAEQKIGTITFYLAISQISEKVMVNVKLGMSSRLMIVDEKGQILYHEDGNKINQNLRTILPDKSKISARLLNFKNGTASYRDQDGRSWIISYHPIKELQWSLSVASPLEPFIKPTKRAGLLGVGITLGIALLLLFLINVFSKKLVQDLAELIEGARAIAGGDFERKIPIRSNDEIGELAADFNVMTADLKQLRRERQANETLLAIGKFSAALAHDLRNPVEGLKLLSRELGKRVDPQRPEHEIADTIVQSVDRLSSLVNQSLDFARLNQPVFAATDLVVLTDEVLKDFRFDEVELKKDFARDLPLVEADAAQIKRVLANLIRNALEACFSKRNSTRCQIGLKLQAHGEKLCIAVADTGPGIAPEIGEKIFEPFFSTKPGGHGLGLALARQIIANHGGTIAFISEMGQGTRFVFELPVA